jgi:histidine ammonia-lyase
VSMGTIAARKLGSIVRNAENVCAMELFCAAQALDFLKPLNPSAGVKAAFDLIRQTVPFAEEDRAFYTDIDQLRKLIRSGEILKSVIDITGELEW